mmetsp:Transcript_7235/g.11539  ORF Transcript_7235/g.11539 Transcript_7235/m.11539 type:complete len:307 (-) Transcript_7235:1266-2186(-)
MKKKGKPSRHGTLGENDTDQAVAVSVNQVLAHCQTATTKDLFGAAGSLPPKSAQRYEPRYIVYYTLKDGKSGANWIGLNKVNNTEKGRIESIPLVPGEYKIELKLSKQLNKNLAHDVTGSVVGGIQSMGLSDEDKAKEIKDRGMPNSYIDVTARVQAKKYAISEFRGILDLGVHSTFTRVFTVHVQDGEACLDLGLFSHSLFKRLKVEGVVFRRDFTPAEPEIAIERRRNGARKGKEIFRKALSSGPPKNRLDDDVSIQAVVREFYEKYAPERLGNLDVVFRHFKGRNGKLMDFSKCSSNVLTCLW